MNMKNDNKDHFEADVVDIFNICAEMTQPRQLALSDDSDYRKNLTKIQSHIIKHIINILPILIDSKRFQMSFIAEMYNKFLTSQYCLQMNFLSKLIKSKLFEVPGNYLQ